MATQELTFKSIIDGLSLPTLQEISIVTLAIQLVENEEIKKIYCEHFSDNWPRTNLSDRKVLKLTHICKSLQLPDILSGKVLRCFHWISNQYINWIDYVLYYLPKLKNSFSKKMDCITYVMNSARWSMGKIDKQKSVHQLFLLENIKDDKTLSDLFRMASRHCLEDDLKILWEKISHAGKNQLIDYCKDIYNATYYWTCKMRGNMREFMEDISSFLKEKEYLEADMDFKDPKNYALILCIFTEDDISVIKYFYDQSDIDIEHLVHVIRKFLENLDYNNDFIWKELDQCADKVHFLLKEIESESVLEKIFHEFFGVFLKISVINWPWHQFFVLLLKMCVNISDQILFYDLISKLIKDVKMGKVDTYEVKMLWENIPNKIKISFCLFICKKHKDRDVDFLWRNLTIEIFNMFLIDEELKNILTPYENHGLLECIYLGRYDLIDFWLQKCIVSERDIVSYLENFIETESVAVIKKFGNYKLNSNLNQFLEWAFKYEDLMNRNKILKVKDEIINENLIKSFNHDFHYSEFEVMKKIMDWILRNRNRRYENIFVNWKRKVIEDLFLRVPRTFIDDSKYYLCDFLSYRVNDSEKIKIMMRKADLNEGEVCYSFLESDFRDICSYLKFLKEYGIDIFLTKRKIFYYIFNNPREKEFENEKLWINIRNLLYWNCESDQEMKTKVEEIKKPIINKFALKCILRCVDKKQILSQHLRRKRALAPKAWRRHEYNLIVAMNNILEFLFERRTKDEEWAIMLFGLKKRVIEKLNGDNFWNGKTYDSDLVRLIKWGEENENIRRGNWDVKKYFIKWLKSNLKAERIPKLILDTDFVSSFLKGDEAKPDFENILWDLKEFFVNKVISDDDSVLTRQLLENIKGFTDFLNWNCFDEARIEDLKIKILVRLFQIDTDQLRTFRLFAFHMSNFFNWCIPKNSSCGLKSNVLKLKRGVLVMIVSTYSKHWDEKYFKKLDQFLFLHSTGDEKDLKMMVIEKYGIKSCSQCLIDRNLVGLRAFVKWAGFKSEESINDFKQNILVEILGVEYVNCWNDQQYWQDIHQFLCDCYNSRFVEVSNMKLDILEIYFFSIFVKLLAEKNRFKLKFFLKFFFDKNLKLNECLPRTQKLIREVFEKFGKDYCIVMMMENDSDGVTDFKNLFFDSKIGIKKNKSLLWTFEKNCMNQVLKNKIDTTLEGENDWNPVPDDFWNCLNKFISFGRETYNLKCEILEYKNFVAENYGIVYFEKYFKCLLKDSSLEFPKNFLKWLFGIKRGKSKTDLNEEKLFDFKKQVLELLVNIKHQDLWGKDYFYKVLNKFLKFNLASANLKAIYYLKRSVCELHGVELCYSWICNNQWNETFSFVEWSFEKSNCKKLKLEIIRKHGADYCNARILSDDWVNLKKFLKWAFGSREKNIERVKGIINLKTETLNSKICYKNYSEIVLRFLEWGFTSKAELNKFKKSILKKSHPLNFFVTKQKYKSKKQFQLWFARER